MSFLVSLSSFFKKQINNIHTVKTRGEVQSCEEFPELCKDDDFIEISRMSSEQLRSEIYSYNQDPDEILALIKGRLDNKIVPISKAPSLPCAINITTLLSNVIDKKIYLDAFSNQPKDNGFSLHLYSVLIVSLVAFLFIPSITETTAPLKNNKLVEKNQSLEAEIYDLRERYKIELAKNQVYQTYDMGLGINKESLQKVSSLSEGGVISESFQGIPLSHNMKDSLSIGKEMPDLLAITMLSQNENTNLSNIQNFEAVSYNNAISLPSASILSTESSPSLKEITIDLKSGDNFYSVTKSRRLFVENWAILNKLSSLREGNRLIIKADDNYVKKVSYVKRDGSVVDYEIEGGTINPSNSQLYYTENLLITGKIIASLSETIKNNEIFANNLPIARVITQKVERYLSIEPTFNFKKIAHEAPYTIEVTVRKNKETRKIIYVEKVKVDELDKFNLASNASF